MLLGEAITEMELCATKIAYLKQRIKDLSVAKDRSDAKKNSALLGETKKDFDAWWQKYQQFSLLVNRAKSAINMKLGTNDVSLSDINIIREMMISEIMFYDDLLLSVSNRVDGDVCIDVEDIITKRDSLLIDSKTLFNKVKEIEWTVDVKPAEKEVVRDDKI